MTPLLVFSRPEIPLAWAAGSDASANFFPLGDAVQIDVLQAKSERLPFFDDACSVDLIVGMLPRRCASVEIEVVQFAVFFLTWFPARRQRFHHTLSC